MGQPEPLVEGTPIQDVRDRLPRVPNRVWDRRKLHDIRGLVVHHTASDDNEPGPTARWHIDHNSWPSLGYTFWIQGNGDVLFCNDLESVVWSQGGGSPPMPFTKSNTHYLSVALRGDLTLRAPTTGQRVALRWFWNWARRKLRIPADMVFGHQEFKATTCPGRGMELVKEFTGQALAVRQYVPRDVLQAQQGLLRLGFEMTPYGADGHWGPVTRAALQAATGYHELHFDSAYALAERLAHDDDS